MKQLEIKTNGMKCEGCEKRMINALKSLKNVEEVTADHTTGIVTVKSTEEIKKETICKKIEEIGFNVKKED